MSAFRRLVPLAAGLVLTCHAQAQEHPPHQVPAPTASPATAQVEDTQAPEPVDHAAMGHGTASPTEVDHAAMGHGTASPTEVDHAAMGHGAAPPTEVDHAAMGHGTASPTEVDHAAMGHGTAPPTEVDHAAMGHGTAPPTEVDHSAMGHGKPAAIDHAAMGHGTEDKPVRVTPVPAPTQAERDAAVRPAGGHSMDQYARNWLFVIDRLETFEVDGAQGLEWEAQAWVGSDLNKLWVRSEGERVGDDLEDADVELLYGRSIAPWWDLVAGVRHHFEPGQAQDMAVLGVMGVAPYKFEVEASLYVGESGYTGARMEVEYDVLLTNRLVLQPSAEVNVHGQDDREHGNGSGLGTVEAGLRLRYEFTRRFAPYVGLVYERAYGRTADFRREAGEDAEDTRLVAGVRVWF